MYSIVDGALFRAMVTEGAYAIEANRQRLNDLNVFPVPDGDTGTNMSLTIGAAAKEFAKLAPDAGIGRVAEVTSMALLRGARGNSGVILSLLFRGIAKRLKGLDTADGEAIAEALGEGVDTAYNAVMKPTEGTILTVSRKAAGSAQEAARAANNARVALSAAHEASVRALAETVDQNPVLKKAGVVDAGGAGFVFMLEAMLRVVRGEPRMAVPTASDAPAAPVADEHSVFEEFRTEDITFGYCTEFIIERENDKSPALLRDFLSEIGDSLVVVDDEEIIKVHVHTDNPGRALEEALTYGPMSTIKIENMRVQHTQQLQASHGHADAGAQALLDAAKATVAVQDEPVEMQPYAFVAVAAGAGLRTIFSDLGVSTVVEGGQTMNPSTEDILEAVQAAPSDIVYVLPNNKNIIMAAEQVAPLTDKTVLVVRTKSVAQGISCMLAFDPSAEQEANREAMENAAARVRTGQMTYAARDSSFEDKRIREGDFIALMDGKLLDAGKRKIDVMKKLARELARDREISYITIIYGEGVTEEEANELRGMLERERRELEIAVIYGGQPVYYYIVSAE